MFCNHILRASRGIGMASLPFLEKKSPFRFPPVRRGVLSKFQNKMFKCRRQAGRPDEAGRI